jgi:hypothetical protein
MIAIDLSRIVPWPFRVLRDRDAIRRATTNLVVTLKMASSDCRPGSAG